MRKKAFKSFVPIGDLEYEEEDPPITRYQASRVIGVKPKGVRKAQLKAQLKRQEASTEVEKRPDPEQSLIDRYTNPLLDTKVDH